ncbi:MAG: response regulator transcription factor [Actinomycetes bacterium]
MARILVVDDEPDIRTLLRIALERVEDFEVAAVASGPDALAEFAAGTFDVVLLDVMMPGMDGLETLDRLRALPGGDRVAVAFLTARTQKTDLETYRGAGAADVLTKPFDPKVLVTRVQQLAAGAS